MALSVDHLVSIPENPAPEGGEALTLTTADGVLLRAALWRGAPGGGTIFLLPGRSEFIEKYFETVSELLARGYGVLALDWRGQGGSERLLNNPRKGHIDDFSQYRRDLDAALAYAAAAGLPRPWRALAHSMGAAALLEALALGERRLQRAVLSAPMVGLAGVSAHGLRAALVRGLNLAGLGGLGLPGGRGKTPTAFDPFEGNVLTSDRARHDRTAATLIAGPDLAIGAPTVSWVAAALRCIRGFEAADFGLAIRCPTLMVVAGGDVVVSTPAAEALALRIRGARAVAAPGARHEVLMERDALRSQFWAAFDAFMPASDG